MSDRLTCAWFLLGDVGPVVGYHDPGVHTVGGWPVVFFEMATVEQIASAMLQSDLDNTAPGHQERRGYVFTYDREADSWRVSHPDDDNGRAVEYRGFDADTIDGARRLYGVGYGWAWEFADVCSECGSDLSSDEQLERRLCHQCLMNEDAYERGMRGE